MTSPIVTCEAEKFPFYPEHQETWIDGSEC